jgi:hypothetical protein
MITAIITRVIIIILVTTGTGITGIITIHAIITAIVIIITGIIVTGMIAGVIPTATEIMKVTG